MTCSILLIGESGIDLFGGQKQLICIARSLFHKPKFLILDEPSASLDNDTIDFLINLLNRLKHEIGILIISHNQILLRSCDYIYELHSKQIKELSIV